MPCPPLYPAQPCYGNALTQSLPMIPLDGGEWQQVVFHIKMNTPDQYDGSQELWIDGQRKIVQQGMRWRTTTDLQVNEIRFEDRKSTRLNSSHRCISYAVFCLKKKISNN